MDELIVVYKAWGEMETEIIKGLLESNGIKFVTESSAAPSVHAFNIDGMGESRIKVHKKDAEKAMAIINEDREQYIEE